MTQSPAWDYPLDMQQTQQDQGFEDQNSRFNNNYANDEEDAAGYEDSEPNLDIEPSSGVSVEQDRDGRPVSNNTLQDLDVEDQIIFDMKKQGFQDVAIAARLEDQGHNEHQPSTINARYTVIVGRVGTTHDDLIDGELADWQDGEDEVLIWACVKADKRILEELEEVRARKFDHVAQEVNHILAQQHFTASSCKERFEALQRGTALPPPELDGDTQTRKREAALGNGEYQERRSVEAEQNAAKRGEQGPFNGATPRTRATANELGDTQLWTAQEHHRRDHSEPQRQRLGHGEQANTGVESVHVMYSKEASVPVETRREEHQVLDRMKTESDPSLVGDEGRDVEEHTMAYGFEADRTTAARGFSAASSGGIGDMPMLIDADQETDMVMPPPPPPAAQSAITRVARSTALASANVRGSGVPARHLPRYRPAPMHVLDDPSIDPREIMAKCELLSLVVERGMTKNREKETKALLNRRIRASDRTATNAEIQAWLFRRGLSAGGNRAERLWRLAEYDATRSRSWRPKHMAVLTKGRNAVQHLFSSAIDNSRRATVMLPRPASVMGNGAVAGGSQGGSQGMLDFNDSLAPAGGQ